MIGYICKYAPVEIMAGFGMDGERILPDEENLDIAEGHIYPSICSYAKSVLQHSLKNDYEALIMTDCCDALKRLNDILNSKSHQNVYQVSIPRFTHGRGIDLYANTLLQLIEKLEADYSKSFDLKAFLRECFRENEEDETDGEYIAFMGSRISPSLMAECEKSCGLPIRDLTCASQNRHFTKPPNKYERMSLMRWYASCLLSQVPCMRMEDIDSRKDLTDDPNLKGVIYHTVKFCDFYNFEYAEMEKNVPMLKLETDYTSASTGQLRTRLEAFFEATDTLKKDVNDREKTIMEKTDRGSGITGGEYYVGIDVGSTSTDAVIVDENGELVSRTVIKTGAKSKDAAINAYQTVLNQAGLQESDIANMITTGYGRNAVDFHSRAVTEISCHAKGVNYFFPEAKSVIDIGGQDSKVISLNDDGTVSEFIMNDKCAAGTGRFLELMASTINITLPEMSDIGLKWAKEETISSMCTVFAESEVISLIAENKETCDIVRGLNMSIAGRIIGLVKRINAKGPFVMSGGVAQNKGVLLALEDKLGEKILVADDPQICGALGAALLAMNNE